MPNKKRNAFNKRNIFNKQNTTNKSDVPTPPDKKNTVKYLVWAILDNSKKKKKIVKLSSPDFGDFQVPIQGAYNGSPNYPKLYAYLETILSKKIEHYEDNNLIIPIPTKASLEEFNSKEKFPIYILLDAPKERFFCKNLPRLGGLANFINALVTIFMTYLTLCLLLAESIGDRASKSLAGVGCFIAFTTIMMQYHFSEADNYWRNVGHSIDRYIAREKKTENHQIKNFSTAQKYFYKFSVITLRLFALAFSAIISIMLRQSIVSVVKDAIAEKVIPPIPQLAIDIIAIVAAVALSLQSTGFNQGFVNLFTLFIINKITQRNSGKSELAPETLPADSESTPLLRDVVTALPTAGASINHSANAPSDDHVVTIS